MDLDRVGTKMGLSETKWVQAQRFGETKATLGALIGLSYRQLGSFSCRALASLSKK